MSKLESYKIKQIAQAFGDTKQKHNQVVELLESIEGGNGIKVFVTEGNIRITRDTSLGGDTPYSTYTFTACVSGTPKTFVIPIVSGPT